MIRSTMRARRGAASAALLTAVIVLATGCGLTIPADPDGTLERIENTGQLRAGATPAGEALRIDGQQVTGPLADLIEGFAGEHGASVDWVVASEESLVDELEAHSLDIAVGGVTDATPWSERVSVTRGYDGIPGSGGRTLVVLLPLGENALQSALERYLDEKVTP